MNDPRLTRLAASLPSSIPFVAPERIEENIGRKFDARLGANELSMGPSPRVIAAMQAAVPEIWKYGLPDNAPLLNDLSEHLGVPENCITIGEGIDGLLGNLVRLFVEQGDHVVTSAGSYPTFNYHVNGFGGVLHTVPYKGDFEDPDALISKAKQVGAKLVYLSNPNNPMGSVHSAQTVQSMIDAVPEGCLMVLDEAYSEFASCAPRPAVDISNPRLIRFRTFSKAYGMAGARIGYGISTPEVATSFDKIRNHFGVNKLAMIGAQAALADQKYLQDVLQKVELGRARIAQIAHNNGLIPLPSASNFVTIDCKKDGNYARAILQQMQSHDIFLRMPGIAPLDRCIRVSVGRPEEIDLFAKALPLVLADLK